MTPLVIGHTGAAFVSFLIGLTLLAMTKGTSTHRLLGRVFVVLMVAVSLSALFIQEISPGQWSWIHLLVPVTLIGLGRGIHRIRRYRKTGDPTELSAHRSIMFSVFVGALMIAGGFTLMPGRAIHTLMFG